MSSSAATAAQQQHVETGRGLPWSESLELSAQIGTSLALANCCIAFVTNRQGMHRLRVVSREGGAAVLHGYNEYVAGMNRFAKVIPASRLHHHISRSRESGAAAAHPSPFPLDLDSCWQGDAALGVAFTVNNLYHAAFHAAPAFEAYQALMRSLSPSQSIDVFPIMHDTAHIGMRFSRTGLKAGSHPSAWHAWEYILRAMTAASASHIAQATFDILSSPCRCYRRLHLSADPFNPLAASSAGRLRAFRDAALANAARSMSSARGRTSRIAAPFAPHSSSLSNSAGPDRWAPSAPSGLYLARRATATAPASLRGSGQSRVVMRGLLREGELAAALASVGVERVVLEDRPLVDQMQHVHSARVLVAIHGQACAWLPFLPWDSGPTSLVEIMARGTSKPAYAIWSGALGIHYLKVRAALAPGPGCGGDDRTPQRHKNWLYCNLTVDPRELRDAALAAVRRSEHGV